MEIRTMKVDELRPANYNPRVELEQGSEEYQKLKRSIEEFGLVDPIIWNKRTGNIVGGHQRYNVLLELGYETVDVSVVDLSLEKEKLLNVALNKISGAWDWGKLEELFAELDGVADLYLTGFGSDEIDKLLGDVDIEPIDLDDLTEETDRDDKKQTCYCPKCGFEFEV